MEYTKNFWQRLCGVRHKGPNFSPLYIPHCTMVHSLGMKYRIKLYWVNQKGLILKIETLNPWRIKIHREAFGVVETPLNHPELGTINENIFHRASKAHRFGGQALVESVLILPFLLFLIIGFFQLGLKIIDLQRLNHAVAYAAQVGSITNDDTHINGALQSLYKEEDIVLQIQSFDGHTHTPINHNQRRYQDLIRVIVAQKKPHNWIFERLLPLQSEASSTVICPEEQAPYTCGER